MDNKNDANQSQQIEWIGLGQGRPLQQLSIINNHYSLQHNNNIKLYKSVFLNEFSQGWVVGS